MCSSEIENRKKLKALGLTNSKRLPKPETNKKTKEVLEDEGSSECDICRSLLFVSVFHNDSYENIYCLPHALLFIEKKKPVLKNFTLSYKYDEVSFFFIII